jgi:hypothetical protein
MSCSPTTSTWKSTSRPSHDRCDSLTQNCEPFELTTVVNLERNEVGIHSYITYFKTERGQWLRISR